MSGFLVQYIIAFSQNTWYFTLFPQSIFRFSLLSTYNTSSTIWSFVNTYLKIYCSFDSTFLNLFCSLQKSVLYLHQIIELWNYYLTYRTGS